MNSTVGVMEAINTLFLAIEGKADSGAYPYFYGQPLPEYYAQHKATYLKLEGKDEHSGERDVPAGAVYVMQFAICVNDLIQRPGMIEDMLHRPKVFKRLTAAAARKYAGMDTAAFAQLLYDICTDKGRKLTTAADIGNTGPIMLERCLYAAYIYKQVSDLLEKQNATFALVPLNNGMRALAEINTGIADIDENTKEGKIVVGNVTFEGKVAKVSTGALMLNDFFLKETHRTRSASLAIPLRDYAIIKGRSTAKQPLQTLKAEILRQMDELKALRYSCYETVNGKKKYSGQLEINGGTAFVVNGYIYWNYNPDLYSQLMAITAPADYPKELWAANPRTSTYYFGRYIATNWRLNEGKPGREKITMRTLTSKSPNLPTYDEVMKGNRDLTGRIVKKTFIDLDALDTLYYDFYTAEGEKVENPEKLDYQTFINGYILVDYSEYPQHPDRVKKGQERRKKAREAKEKAQLAAAAKAAAENEQ